jgi:hypothetical protein
MKSVRGEGHRSEGSYNNATPLYEIEPDYFGWHHPFNHFCKKRAFKWIKQTFGPTSSAVVRPVECKNGRLAGRNLFFRGLCELESPYSDGKIRNRVQAV